MLTTEDAKRIGKIMLDGSPKTAEKVQHIVRQIQMIPDAIRVDFGAVHEYLFFIVSNEQKKCTGIIDFNKKEIKID